MSHPAKLVAILDYWHGFTNRDPSEESTCIEFSSGDKTKELKIQASRISRVLEYATVCEALVYFDEINGYLDDDGPLAAILGEKWEKIVQEKVYPLGWFSPTEKAMGLPDEEFKYQLCYTYFTFNQEWAATEAKVYMPSPYIRSVLKRTIPLQTLLTGIVESSLVNRLKQMYISTRLPAFACPLPPFFLHVLKKAGKREEIISAAFELREKKELKGFRMACADLLYELYEGKKASGLLSAETSAKRIGDRLCSHYGYGAACSIDFSISLSGPSISKELKSSGLRQMLWEWKRRDLVRGLSFHSKIIKEIISDNSALKDISRLFDIDTDSDTVEQLSNFFQE